MMGCGLRSGQSIIQANTLSQGQKLLLKQMMLQIMELHDQDLPQPTKGWEGILVADEILREEKARGILIGGLAEAVWNRRRKISELDSHKDVDVLVIDDDFSVEKFAGGIDWWLPRKESLPVRLDDVSVSILPVKWWENGNGIRLRFGLQIIGGKLIDDGLYIPESDWIITMRMTESLANVDTRIIEVDINDLLEEKFEKRIRRKRHIKTSLPNFFREKYGGRVFGLEDVDVIDFEYEEMVAINKY